MIRFAAYFLSFLVVPLAAPLATALSTANSGTCINPSQPAEEVGLQSPQNSGKKTIPGYQAEFLGKIGKLAEATIEADDKYPHEETEAFTKDPLRGKLIRYCVPAPPEGLQILHRFPREYEFTPFDSEKPSSIDLTYKKNIIDIEFQWCLKGCPNPSPDLLKSYPEDYCPRVDDTNTLHRCIIDVVLARDLYDVKAPPSELPAAFVLTPFFFEVNEELIKKSISEDISFPTFVINGYTLKEYFSGDSIEDYFTFYDTVPGAPQAQYLLRSGWNSVREFYIERFPPDTSCRPYSGEESKEALDVIRWDYDPVDLNKANGITLYPPKVYDVFTLRQMLATTAAQLAGLAGFNQQSINAAFGNIQGVTTDTSYLSAQVTTVGTPSVVSQAVNGTTGSNVLGTSNGQNGAVSGSSSTISCPAGTLPGIGTGGLPACVPVVTSASATSGNPVGFTGANNVNGGSSTVTGGTNSGGSSASNSSSNTQNTNQQNTTTTTSGGQVGTIAPIPVANVPSTPTNIGVSSQDILTEQVQLNSEITTLRMALQGALSDQYLATPEKATSTRQQTTLGFNISIDPPQRYKHAVAEVRIWVYPINGVKPISIVNLLPTAKTYNVAKITSNQKAFGAGVVIDMVNVGVAGGKTKNRLYLAKDTDTVAVEYFANKPAQRKSHDQEITNQTARDTNGERDSTAGWPHGAVLLKRSVQEHIGDVARQAEIWQKIEDACAENPAPDAADDLTYEANPVIFGWQFRPVLGADYVQSGLRQVFAQLAMPSAPGQLAAPKVFIQTRWREYDEKRQVVGPVYSGSCSFIENRDPVVVQNPLKVKRVYLDDIGGGVLKVRADGMFYSQGFSVMNGPNVISPATFDGGSIQFFANAATLLASDDLTLVAETGETTPLTIKPVPKDERACDIESATLAAVPRPDGNSWVEAKVVSGASYSLKQDQGPHSLFLIGSQVYGLRETPFLESYDDTCTPADSKNPTKGLTCTYHFLASTSVLRSAQTFAVRDLSWATFRKSGKIEFDPSFSGLTSMTSGSSTASTEATQTANKTPPVYILSGAELLKLVPDKARWNCALPNCLEVFKGFSQFPLNADNFAITSPTTAILRAGPQTPTPALTLQSVKGKNVSAKINLSVKDPEADKKPSVPAWTIAAPDKRGRQGGPVAKRNAGKPKKEPQPRTLYIYTINGAPPSIPNDVKPDPQLHTVYDDSPSIDPSILHDGSTTIKVIAVAPNQMPSDIAIAMFYKKGKSIMPLDTAPFPTSNYNAYRFVWHSTTSALANPVEWDLNVPADTAKTTVNASTLLNQGDVTEIDFTGVDVLANTPSTPITFTFNNALVQNAIYNYDSTKKVLKLMTTDAMTAKPGHKVVLLNAYVDGADHLAKPTQILLPFDVTRR